MLADALFMVCAYITAAGCEHTDVVVNLVLKGRCCPHTRRLYYAKQARRRTGLQGVNHEISSIYRNLRDMPRLDRCCGTHARVCTERPGERYIRHGHGPASSHYRR